MKKILTVLVNEVVSVVSRPSFWFGVLGLPIAAALIFALVGWINRGSAAAQAVTQVFATPQQGFRPEGYVDLSGTITTIPDTVPAGIFTAYPDEASARRALADGTITAFYLIPADYIQSGKLIYIRPDFNPLASDSTQSSLFEWILNVNLAGGDLMKASLLNGPLNVEEVSLAAAPTPDENNMLAYMTPYVITLLFYMLIISSASLLLGNITKEKENRIMEVLLTSVTPTQMLTGKIIALGLVGLGQTIVWLGMSYILLNRSTAAFQLSSVIHLPPSFLAWGLLFFLLGYAVYASLMAGLGALAPNLREASQATFIIMLPLMVPLFLASTVFSQEPNGPIATFLSLFPLSAPVAMMARLSAGGVPGWQPWLAAVLLALTVVLIVRAVAGMFRAQSLLSGQVFNVKVYLRALVGK